jgi:hypothetical protein
MNYFKERNPTAFFAHRFFSGNRGAGDLNDMGLVVHPNTMVCSARPYTVRDPGVYIQFVIQKSLVPETIKSAGKRYEQLI